MAFTIGGDQVYTDPRTPAQMRSTLAQIKSDIAQARQIVGYSLPAFASVTAAGLLVYAKSDGTVGLADADTAATARVEGMALRATEAGDIGPVASGGAVTMDAWNSVIGATLLTPGSIYFLSATAGMMTTTPPSSVGQTVVQIGKALTTKIFIIAIGPTVLL